MKILFVWTGLTSYMGDCWRTLAQVPGVELKVVVSVKPQSAVAFKADAVLRELDARVVVNTECVDELVGDRGEWRPDVAFIVGWRDPVCRAFVQAEPFRAIPKVCCFDMPWRWKLRCLVAPLVLGSFLRRYESAYVPGAFCARYAKWLGFKTIYRGLFGIDTTRVVEEERERKNFLYIGRYSREKRLDVLLAGYKLYRATGGTRELHLCGKGDELPAGIENVSGVKVNGFVAPEKIPGLMRSAVAFVLASEFDPWPLVLIEAMSAGCQIVASDKCTNWPELGKNWLRFKCGDVKALAEKMHEADGRMNLEAERSENLALARQYDCRAWSERTLKICSDILTH